MKNVRMRSALVALILIGALSCTEASFPLNPLSAAQRGDLQDFSVTLPSSCKSSRFELSYSTYDKAITA